MREQHTFVDQRLIGEIRRIATDSDRRGELSRGRQLLPSRQPTRRDQLTKVFDELAVDRSIAASIGMKGKLEHTAKVIGTNADLKEPIRSIP
jgi:hypothetical protein